MASAPGSQHKPSTDPAERFPPSSNAAVFRDLLIFEERLKQNAARLRSRKQKYQSSWETHTVFLVMLCTNWLLHYLRIGLLMVSCTMLFLFFASGIYSDRITAANKYVAPSLRFIPQANRSLRTFNMYLNMRTVSQLPRWLAATPFRRAQDSEPVPADASSCAKEKLAPSSPRRMFQRRTAVQIPPTRNARGEIVFSSRVDSNFREGYERYRNAFERKRREKLEAQRRSKPAWFSSFWSSQEKPPSQEKEAPLHLKAS